MKTDRSYYKYVTVKDVVERDFLQTGLRDFLNYVRRPTALFTFTSEYVGRLEVISHEVYGTVDLWWVIAVVNGIVDPFDDSLINTRLTIPDITDVFEFYDENYVSEAA